MLYVPPPGLNVGVAARSVKVAEATGLLLHPPPPARALMVVVRVTEIGPVYGVEDAVGVLPLVV
jgi:hypothetical protein